MSKSAKSHRGMRDSGCIAECVARALPDHWTAGEVDEVAFKDAHVGRRFGQLLTQVGDGMGESIPFACLDWANTKAAYRFFANDRVDEGDILSGHFAATRARYDASKGTILLIQETTEFSYQRAAPYLVGMTKSVNNGHDKRGRLPRGSPIWWRSSAFSAGAFPGSRCSTARCQRRLPNSSDGHRKHAA